MEGLWDVVSVGLAIGGLALLVLLLARTLWERLVALVAVLILIPAYFGIVWLGNVQIRAPDGDMGYCLMRGPVDPGTSCGAAYLGRYAALMVPLTLLLVALLWVLVRQVRGRIRRRLPSPA